MAWKFIVSLVALAAVVVLSLGSFGMALDHRGGAPQIATQYCAGVTGEPGVVVCTPDI